MSPSDVFCIGFYPVTGNYWTCFRNCPGMVKRDLEPGNMKEGSLIRTSRAEDSEYLKIFADLLGETSQYSASVSNCKAFASGVYNYPKNLHEGKK
jgi:hypothetical protein